MWSSQFWLSGFFNYHKALKHPWSGDSSVAKRNGEGSGEIKGLSKVIIYRCKSNPETLFWPRTTQSRLQIWILKSTEAEADGDLANQIDAKLLGN